MHHMCCWRWVWPGERQHRRCSALTAKDTHRGTYIRERRGPRGNAVLCYAGPSRVDGYISMPTRVGGSTPGRSPAYVHTGSPLGHMYARQGPGFPWMTPARQTSRPVLFLYLGSHSNGPRRTRAKALAHVQPEPWSMPTSLSGRRLELTLLSSVRGQLHSVAHASATGRLPGPEICAARSDPS